MALSIWSRQGNKSRQATFDVFDAALASACFEAWAEYAAEARARTKYAEDAAEAHRANAANAAAGPSLPQLAEAAVLELQNALAASLAEVHDLREALHVALKANASQEISEVKAERDSLFALLTKMREELDNARQAEAEAQAAACSAERSREEALSELAITRAQLEMLVGQMQQREQTGNERASQEVDASRTAFPMGIPIITARVVDAEQSSIYRGAEVRPRNSPFHEAADSIPPLLDRIDPAKMPLSTDTARPSDSPFQIIHATRLSPTIQTSPDGWQMRESLELRLPSFQKTTATSDTRLPQSVQVMADVVSKSSRPTNVSVEKVCREVVTHVLGRAVTRSLSASAAERRTCRDVNDTPKRLERAFRECAESAPHIA